MLQMVASGRGVAALPRWLVEEYADKMDVVPVRLGPDGIAKQIFLGAREADLDTDYCKPLSRWHANLLPHLAKGKKHKVNIRIRPVCKAGRGFLSGILARYMLRITVRTLFLPGPASAFRAAPQRQAQAPINRLLN